MTFETGAKATFMAISAIANNSRAGVHCKLKIHGKDKELTELGIRLFIYSISRLKARPAQKLAFRPKRQYPSKDDNMAHEGAMKAALAELEMSSKSNYTAVAEKHKLGRHALSRRHQPPELITSPTIDNALPTSKKRS